MAANPLEGAKALMQRCGSRLSTDWECLWDHSPEELEQ